MPRSVYQRIRSSIQRWCHLGASSGGTKNSISICSNSRVRKMKLPGGDLVAEGLADLGDPERRLLAGELEDVLEVDEDALGGLGAQVDLGAGLLDGPMWVSNMRLNWRGSRQLAAALGAADLALGVLGAQLLLAHVVLAPALLALAQALHQRVGEALEVAGGLPGPRVHEDRGVERDHVVALLDHRAPPLGLDVVLQQHAVVAVVVGRAEPAVDLGGLEDEAAPLAERDDLLEGDLRHAGQASCPADAAAPAADLGATFR